VEQIPAVWVVDAKGTAVYRGAIDDNADPSAAQKHHLKEALNAVVAGGSVAVAETKAVGTDIKKAPRRPRNRQNRPNPPNP
jgi:hypothetical protein